ncbi:MAG: hypothetical protein WAT58_00010 [Candidatus Dormiibacterota bacterium]
MNGPWPRGVGFYGLLGAVLVIVSSFLPWLTLGGKTDSAWQFPLLALLPGSLTGGPPVGVLLLVAVLVVLPYAIRRPLPDVLRILIAAIASNLALALLIIEVRYSPAIFPGLGVIVALMGALLLMVGDAGERRRSRLGGPVG